MWYDHYRGGWDLSRSAEVTYICMCIYMYICMYVCVCVCVVCITGVARFCHVEHQKKAWRTSCPFFAHKLLCPILKSWGRFLKSKLDKDACRQDLMRFLSKASGGGGEGDGLFGGNVIPSVQDCTF